MANKIIIEEFDICHKLINIFKNLCFNNDYPIIDNVSCDCFVIFIHYNDDSAKIINKEVNTIKKLSVAYELE